MTNVPGEANEWQPEYRQRAVEPFVIGARQKASYLVRGVDWEGVAMLRRVFALLSLMVVLAAARFGGQSPRDKDPGIWTEVAAGVFRSPGLPAGHALVDGTSALLIDAPHDAAGLQALGIRQIEMVLLTHHHHDTCAAAGQFLAERVPVRAPRASAPWLLPDSVQKFWNDSLPLRNSNAAYMVVPVGLDGVDCSLNDGQTLDWHGWTVQVVATPGHARDHLAYAARKGKDKPPVVFCGDALAAPGKLWTPYTTDWDHWTDAGLKPAALSLRKLAELKPILLLPAHGPAIVKDAAVTLSQTAVAVEELAFLKSFERYTKQRRGDAPNYRFLAKEQAESNGSKPWSQISEHLFITGNTYVLTSKDHACLVVDPWDLRSANQVVKLRNERQLGPVEVVLFSHAHYDHYDGIYHMADRAGLQTWTLDCVARPLAEPLALRAPFLDGRPVKIDRRFKEGDTALWREYHFEFHHLPGQTEFTMGVVTEIDGKKCYLTGDNFFHQDQFSGSGGWMGLNRSWPLYYATSAQRVLDARPDWVLAEHGGPFTFSAEDFRRRVDWGRAAAQAADAVCVSGNHRRDWDPHRIHFEPLVQKARPGARLQGTLLVHNALAARETVTVQLEGRGLIGDQTWELEVPGGQTVRREVSFRLADQSLAGRHIFLLRTRTGQDPDPSDSFLGIDVE
jgi:glyoxylase-like metal-dependent hydrolase (beta-lactamase superfamily II)